jgi:hypothetical protein
MAGEDIRIANNVRQILGRHYIRTQGVRVMVGRGAVRIIGHLERAEAKANMPIDDDYIQKLKHEIHRVKGVKTVAISIPDDGEKKEE